MLYREKEIEISDDQRSKQTSTERFSDEDENTD